MDGDKVRQILDKQDILEEENIFRIERKYEIE